MQSDDRSVLPDNAGCVRGSSSEPLQQPDLVAGPSPSAGPLGALCEARVRHTYGVRRPKAVSLDFDDTLFDNSVVPATVERACDAIADAVEALDSAALLQANIAAWNSYWPEVERRCWVGEMDVLDVSREVWRRALDACGHDDPSVVALAYDTHQQIGREMSRRFDDVPGFLAALLEAEIATALVINSSTRTQLAKLEAVGLESAFDAVVISASIGVAKPDVAIFEAALGRLRLTSTDVWRRQPLDGRGWRRSCRHPERVA
jgi:FMN phosphatase YigB (HAD superfamily)